MTRQTITTKGGNAVEVRGLVKHFGEVKAVDGVDLNVREGTPWSPAATWCASPAPCAAGSA